MLEGVMPLVVTVAVFKKEEYNLALGFKGAVSDTTLVHLSIQWRCVGGFSHFPSASQWSV
jgi:hypothetical protein